MPDVEVKYHPRMLQRRTGEFGYARHPISKDRFLDILQEEVAKQMDCLDDKGEKITHDAHSQIAIPVFEPITGRSKRPLLIVVTAYDWPDRMATIGERLWNIGERMRKACGLPEDSVGMSFNPLPRGEYPGGCWVAA